MEADHDVRPPFESIASHTRRATEALRAGRTAEAWDAAQAAWGLWRQATEPPKSVPLDLVSVRVQLQALRGDGPGLLATVLLAEQLRGPHPDLWILKGDAHTLLAWRAEGPTQRRGELAAARLCYEAALKLAGTPSSAQPLDAIRRRLARNGLGAIWLLRGDANAALQAFDVTLTEQPADAGAALGKAETLAAIGRGAEAAAILNSHLGKVPEAWVIAAKLAESRGQIGNLVTFAARAVDAAAHGLLPVFRAEEARALKTRVRTYMGAPQSGPGAAGAACALMAGLQPTWQAVQLDSLDRRELSILVANLLRLGRGRLIGRLLEPEAEQALPGLHEIIRAGAKQLKVPLPHLSRSPSTAGRVQQTRSPSTSDRIQQDPSPLTGEGRETVLPRAEESTRGELSDPGDSPSPCPSPTRGEGVRTSYSILIPTIRQRDDLLEIVIRNTKAVFGDHDYEICLVDVSGKAPPAFIQDAAEVRYAALEKPAGQDVYVPFPEALDLATKDAIIVWADDLLFSAGFARWADEALAAAKQVVQAPLVDPELYVVFSQYFVNYTPAVISRAMALRHRDQLGPGWGQDVPFLEACIRDADLAYEFLDQAYILHLGYPVGKGSNSTLADYETAEAGGWLARWLEQCRSEHDYRQVRADQFPGYEQIAS
ncbi:MAG: tetratricopeptide repeat protein [Chloroflexi bacterium]|nr:tetratricopeptide repeat protein [Chloroflexota bacterium]